jgi:hypothetical protein
VIGVLFITATHQRKEVEFKTLPQTFFGPDLSLPPDSFFVSVVTLALMTEATPAGASEGSWRELRCVVDEAIFFQTHWWSFSDDEPLAELAGSTLECGLCHATKTGTQHGVQ